MIQIENLLKNALCSGVNSPVERQSLFTQTAPDIGLLHSFSHPDFIEVTRNGGQLNPCLNNVCAMIQPSSQDLQNLKRFKQTLKP